jgi:hypothetical protein
LLEVESGFGGVVPYGILLADGASNGLILRLRPTAEMAELCDLEEREEDILDALEDDLRLKGVEYGALGLFDRLEDSLSGFLRISDRAAVSYRANPEQAADRLFDQYVDSNIHPFETHLPFYGLRAAATKFGESMAPGEAAGGALGEDERWIRIRNPRLRLQPSMFVAQVVGRSMEPLIPDNSLCIFRTGVTGSRQGKYLLIEKFSESDFANRYTVKRYTSRKRIGASDGEAWEHEAIRLEPVNPEFDAFELAPDEFRVIAEFVEVLGSSSN